jgi:nitric oxide reductase activation protein
MGGSKWNKTMTNIVALAKAVDMIPNLNIQISFRTTSNDSTPYIVVAYDSRVDKFIKVKQLFCYLHPNGTTPEGLCFEAVMKQMVGSNGEIDSYFLNISDGEPYYHGKGMSYQGSGAAKHTRKMVKKMKEQGINVMAYFVSDYGASGSSETKFKRMYGEDSRFIDIENIVPITKTLNELFLKK